MSNDQYQKAVWMRPVTTANGVTMSVSDKSGLVKFEVDGTGRRSPLMYHDEIMTFLACAIEIQKYLNDNTDIIRSAGQSREDRKILKTQLKASAKLAEALEAVSPEVLERLLQAKLAKQA